MTSCACPLGRTMHAKGMSALASEDVIVILVAVRKKTPSLSRPRAKAANSRA